MYYYQNLNALNWILLLIPIVIAIYAQWKVGSAFKKGSQIPNSKGMTGAQAAQAILQSEQLGDLPVNQVQGRLSDHYNPVDRSLSLSPEVYSGASISAIGVAAHEVGHAIQHKESYGFLMLRTTFYPVVRFSSWLAPMLIIGGFIFTSTPYLLEVGIIIFAASVFFTLITLPVEFDASKRAMIHIQRLGLVTGEESIQVKKVLDAAALTYVAAAITAVMELIRLILIARSND